jgi:gluconate 2-dehydrogenase gamma chain
MSEMDRRRALKVLGAAPFVGAAVLDAQPPATGGQQPNTPHVTPQPPAQNTNPQPPKNQATRKFFTAKEARTAGVLADDIIPRDAKSGSATEAGVVEYIDFHMSVPETDDATRVQMRGGLRWLDTESKRRFGVGYAAAKTDQRHAILDDIAYPDKTTPEFRAGTAFFTRFRDLVGGGFFSSAMGWKDLQYIGNTFNPNWSGCPDAAMRKLGVSHDLMNTRIPSQVQVSETPR